MRSAICSRSQIDPAALLPNDSEAYGFDNIADVLGTDPSLMDRYLSAAWKVTSAAIGDVSMAPAVSTYRVPRIARKPITSRACRSVRAAGSSSATISRSTAST